MYAVTTVCIGDKFKKIGDITHNSMRNYAKRINADFVILDDKIKGQEDIIPHFAKLKIYELLKDYERIIYLDSDIIVRSDTPNLFNLIPEDKFGIFQEGSFIPRRKLDLEMAAKTYSTKIIGINPDKWRGEYYNSGVMVFSKRHRTVFIPPEFNKVREVEGAWDYGEQGWINLQLINGDVPILPIHYTFNRMSIMDQFTGEHRLSSYIVHYAGAPEVISTPNGAISLCEFIKSDLNKWEESNDYSEFKRGIYIRVGGGLGDQVDAEPVVRHIKENVYPDAEFVIASDWPRIFKHLNCSCDKPSEINNYIKTDQPYYRMETLPIPESNFGIAVSHPLVHSTDYSSLSCLKTILPRDKKQIKLLMDVNDASNLISTLGIKTTNKIRNTIMIHPGRGWISKTFPSVWWQSVIDGISEKGYKVCLIGKSIGDDQGLVDVNIPDNCIDLRDKTDIGSLFGAISMSRVLISNDSAPIHIAGAFNNYIICIPTCKHPDHIMPWRNGSQTYKAKTLYKKLLIGDICNNPTEVHGQTVDWIPSKEYTDLPPAVQYHTKNARKNGSILEYIPEPEEVINEAYLSYEESLKEDKDD